VNCGFLNNGVQNTRVGENMLASALVEIYAFFDVFMELTEWLKIPREECSDAFCGAKHGSTCVRCSSNYEYGESELVERARVVYWITILKDYFNKKVFKDFKRLCMQKILYTQDFNGFILSH